MDLNFKRNPARMKTMQPEAEQKRMAYAMPSNDDKADAFLNAILAGLGSQVTELASHMPKPCPELDAAEHCA